MRRKLDIWRHLWKNGHSIEVRKFVTTLAKSSDIDSKGWLFVCDCGKQWSV